MTYQGKTIKKHARGNWFARVRHGSRVISIYGRTQLDCYDKLKLVVDKVQSEKAIASAERYLARLHGMTTHNFVQVATPQAESKAKPSYTLKQWFDEWLGSYKVGNVRQATIDSFKRTIPYLKKLFDTDINEITSLMLSKAINETIGCRAKDKIHNMCRQMFTIAFNNRIVETNPTIIIPKPKQYAKFEKKAFTVEQEKKFVDLCLENLDKYEPLLICLVQGIRKGEMLALKPNDLNFKQNTLRIDESYDHQYPDDMETKNPASRRTMPMFDLTKQLLLKYKDHDENERIYKNFNGATLGKHLGDLLAKNDLPRMTLHELRHTFITRCHEKKIDELVIQKWVGHAKGSRMTKAVYTHIMDTAENNFIATMNGLDKGTDIPNDYDTSQKAS